MTGIGTYGGALFTVAVVAIVWAVRLAPSPRRRTVGLYGMAFCAACARDRYSELHASASTCLTCLTTTRGGRR